MTATTALAFDFGLRSIGVAYGQSLTGTAQALAPLKAKDGIPQWQRVEALIKEWQPKQLVVGLPLHMDGSESDLSTRARKFGKRLHGRYTLPVAMMDERLTSFSVKQDVSEQGHKGNYKHKPIDSYAAQMILEDWFRQRSD